MAFYFDEPSRTFNEYLLVPGYTSEETIPANVSLKTPLVKYRRGEEEPAISLNTPMVSAIMQAVSDDKMAIALATEGGLSFIYGSQSIEDQAAMITEGANPHGKLLGIVTDRDYRLTRMGLDTKVADVMTPLEKLVTAPADTSLKLANDIIWEHKLNSLPLLDDNGNLAYMVFRKDYDQHKSNPLEMLDEHKRYMVGAGINSRDYAERVPALVEAGVDVVCIDSSEGYSVWQAKTIAWIREHYGDSLKVGAGNVVDEEGFRFLADAGADFIKIGIGGGSICITREQKGIGRGQATATIEVAKARNKYFEETGVYIPLCSDGGIVYDHHITLALAMGSDFVMLGRYFARFDEAPNLRVQVNGSYMKEYWGEGSSRARNWQRYDLGGDKKGMTFEEGVDSYVPYAGPLKDNVAVTLAKIKSTMCNCGAITIPELQEKAKLTVVSSTSIVEGGAHDVMLKDKTPYVGSSIGH